MWRQHYVHNTLRCCFHYYITTTDTDKRSHYVEFSTLSPAPLTIQWHNSHFIWRHQIFHQATLNFLSMHYAQLFYSSVFIDYSYILINVCIKERVTHRLSHTKYVSGRNEEYVTAYAWLLVGSCPCSCSSCSNASVIIVSVMAGTYQNSVFTFNL